MRDLLYLAATALLFLSLAGLVRLCLWVKPR
jgi:hypothetical protein